MTHFNESHPINCNAYFHVHLDAEIDQSSDPWYLKDVNSASASGSSASPPLTVRHTTPFQSRKVPFQEATEALALLRLEKRKGQNRSAYISVIEPPSEPCDANTLRTAKEPTVREFENG